MSNDPIWSDKISLRLKFYVGMRFDTKEYHGLLMHSKPNRKGVFIATKGFKRIEMETDDIVRIYIHGVTLEVKKR